MEIAAPLRGSGWEVEIESKDGARAARRIGTLNPDAVVIYLDRLPSHDRETARYLRSRPENRDLPVIFVDGRQEALGRIKTLLPDATYTTSEKLENALGELSSRSTSPQG